jgi:hypothetical protein
MRGPLSAVRREVRSLAPGGRITRTQSEELDGRGNLSRIARSAGLRPAANPARSAAPENANGVSAVSPGLPRSGYPGLTAHKRHNPEGVADLDSTDLETISLPSRSLTPATSDEIETL